MLARGGEETREHDKDPWNVNKDLVKPSPSGGFCVATDLKPAGDQPHAIEKIPKLFRGATDKGAVDCVTLHGATGTGKTFVLAKVIEELKKPTLILCHNKALAEQLHAALDKLFPEASVGLYISALELYAPATVNDQDEYCPATKGGVDKEAERRRRDAVLAVDRHHPTIVVASTAAIFPSRSSMSGEAAEEEMTRAGLTREQLAEFIKAIQSELEKDVSAADEQVKDELQHAKGDLSRAAAALDEFLERAARAEHAPRQNRFKMFLDPQSVGGQVLAEFQAVAEKLAAIARRVVRLEKMVQSDLDDLKSVGTCDELHDKYGALLPLSVRGTLFQKFNDSYSKDWLLVFDESHASMPAFSRASKSSLSRLKKLANGGYRLRIAAETDGPSPGGPLSRERIWALKPEKTLFISATPGDEELERCSEAEAVVKMVQRPTHILDPVVEVHDQDKKMHEIIGEIRQVCNGNGQVIMATTTQKEAEAMSLGLRLMGIRAGFIHSGLQSSTRNCTIQKFRQGGLHVLIGIGLIMEGLDFPRVELVIILDAHKGGLHRNQRCFEQLAGRAARNTKGRVFLCSSKGKVTPAMRGAMNAMRARREAQMAYNKAKRLEPIPLESEASPDSSSSSTSSQLPTARGEDEVEKEWCKKPERWLDQYEQLIDWVALVGSKAFWTQYDKFPGCDGIGPASAWELIKEYGSLQKVVRAAHEGKLTKVARQSLKKFAEQALINKEKLLLWQRWHLVPGVKMGGDVDRSYYRIARDHIPRAASQAQPDLETPSSEAAREPASACTPVEAELLQDA